MLDSKRTTGDMALELLGRDDFLSANELAEMTGRTRQTVHWTMQKLLADGSVVVSHKLKATAGKDQMFYKLARGEKQQPIRTIDMRPKPEVEKQKVKRGSIDYYDIPWGTQLERFTGGAHV